MLRSSESSSLGLTVNPQVQGTSVLASNEGVLARITPEGLRDRKSVQLSDGQVVEAVFQRELDLYTISQPAALHIVLIHFKLQNCPMLLQNLQKGICFCSLFFLFLKQLKQEKSWRESNTHSYFLLLRLRDVDVPALHCQMGLGDTGSSHHRVLSTVRHVDCLDHQPVNVLLR